MKKNLIFVIIAVLLVMAGCKSKQEEEQKTSYTLMFYAVGGGNLDDNLIGNIYALMGGADDGIKMTFEYKLSKHLQNSQDSALAQFDGVRRWSSEEPENQEIIQNIKHNAVIPNFPSCLKTERIHDAQYFMGSADALSEFITWSAQKCPAEHYILIISDHGNGWNITIDGAVCAGDPQPTHKAHKAVLFDDNVDDKCSTTTDLLSGIQKSQNHIDMIYMDACLMSLAENIYPLIGTVDYYMSSLEAVPGVGGAYDQFLQLLKAQPSNLFAAMGHYCDYCVSDKWWENIGQSFDGPNMSADIAIYDLNKMQPAFDAIREFANLMSEYLQSDKEYIQTLEDGSQVHYKYRELVENATVRAELAMSSKQNLVPLYFTVSTSILPQLFGEEGFVCSVRDFLVALSNPEFMDILMSNPEALQMQINAILQYSNYGVCIADYMKQMSQETARFGETRFTTIHANYLAAIKSASHISGTLAGKNLSAPYEDASMAVNVYSLSEEGFHYFGDGIKFLFQGNRYAKDYTREQLIRYYRASEFDQFAKWSEVLIHLNINPSFLTNSTRYEKYAVN